MGLPTFTYTGNYELITDSTYHDKVNWRLKLKSSGTLTFTSLASSKIDVFMVGGGGGAGSGAGGGGAGGYAKTVKEITPTLNTAYTVTIGGGGSGGTSDGNGGNGGTTSTSLTTVTASGGGGGRGWSGSPQCIGGTGGSGGGSGAYNQNGGNGGSNGGNGSAAHFSGGSGDGQSKYEFGDTNLTLYAGGGGGGGASGGSGGGANGATSGSPNGNSALANTGGGGGGSWWSRPYSGGAGGSGIVVIRNSDYYENYYLTFVSNNPTLGTVPDSGWFAQTDLSITASNTNGYFIKWNDGSSNYTTNPLTYSVSADKTFTAYFANITFTYNSSLGSISKSQTNNILNLTATPNSNAQFIGWYVNSVNVSTSTAYAHTVLNDAVIEARFDYIYGITDNVDGNGAMQYTRGTDKNDVTFSVIPEANHHFTQYKVEFPLSAIFPDGLESAGDVYDEQTQTKAIKRIKRMVLDGSEDWAETTYGSALNCFSIPLYDAPYSLADSGKIVVPLITSRFENPTTLPTSDNRGDKAFICFFADASNTFLSIGKSSVTGNTVSDFKSFLQSNNIEAVYPLATPIEEDLSIDLSYQVHQGGTEQLLPENGTEPTTSPLLADIQYPDELRTNQQFTYRECPTTQDGTATIQSLKGNTVVWNQLVNISLSVSEDRGITYTKITDSSMSISGTSTIGSGRSRCNISHIQMQLNHKYLCKGCPAGGSENTYYFGISGIPIDFGEGGIYHNTQYSELFWVRFDVAEGQTVNFTNVPLICVDLTQMFGLGNEPTVAEWNALFSLPRYSYQLGKLLSFTGTGLKSTGKNLYNAPQFSPRETNGITFTWLNSSSVNIKGSASRNAYLYADTSVLFKLHKGSYVVSNNLPSISSGAYGRLYKSTDGINFVNIADYIRGNHYVSFTLDGDYSIWFTISVPSGTEYSGDGINVELQIEFGSSPSSYEPYTTSTLYFTTATQYFTETPLYLHLRSDIIITAYFVEDDKFHITASTDFKYGSIYISDNDVYSGTVVTLWARPFPDYNFVQWDDGTYSNPKSITVTEDVTIVAEYQRVLESNGIYQYRCFVKDQLDMEGSPKAFMVVDSFDVKRDIMTKATSSITVLEMAGNINDGDVLVLYDPKGTFLYNGVINSIQDKTLKCSQMSSFYKGTWIYNTSSQSTLEQEIAVLLQDYADGKMFGATWIDSQVAQRLGGITIDYVGATSVNLPTDLDDNGNPQYSQKDMEDFIYELYEKYNIIFDFEINISGTNYVHIKVPTFTPLKVGNNMYAIKDMSPITTIEETNKLIIYAQDKSYRATYIATKNDIVKEPSTTANRFDITNTAIVFSDDPEADLVANNLPETMYNHKLTFTLIIKNFIYQFGDFKLGGSLDVYHNDDYYNSVLTGYQIKKSSNRNITEVTFTCGKVRNSLTNKLTLRRVL